jgi:hypothetical protein
MPKKKNLKSGEIQPSNRPTPTESNEGNAGWNELVWAYQLEEATIAADAAFSARDYKEVVRLLSPFADVLDEMQAMKLEFCMKRSV